MTATPQVIPASAGQVARVMAEVAAIVAKSGTVDSLQVLLASGFLHQLLSANPDQIDPVMFRQTISDEAYPPYLTHRRFEVELNTDLSWSKIDGGYDLVEIPRSRFTLGTPTNETRKEKLRLANFSRSVRNEGAVAAFQARQWRPPFFGTIWNFGLCLPDCSPIDVRGREVVCVHEQYGGGWEANVISFSHSGRRGLRYIKVPAGHCWAGTTLFLLTA